jgi:hypothetical protein
MLPFTLEEEERASVRPKQMAEHTAEELVMLMVPVPAAVAGHSSPLTGSITSASEAEEVAVLPLEGRPRSRETEAMVDVQLEGREDLVTVPESQQAERGHPAELPTLERIAELPDSMASPWEEVPVPPVPAAAEAAEAAEEVDGSAVAAGIQELPGYRRLQPVVEVEVHLDA